MNNDWYLRSRRRYFLDYHIDGWNDEFLAKYDPEVYAEACFKSGATAATYMANTHSGLLNWQSETGGEVHPSLKGRDMLQETIDALHKRGMDAIVYYVFVYVADYWEKHPSARSQFADGTYTGKFLLEDLFGVRLSGRTEEITTYVSPTQEGEGCFTDSYTAEFPVTVHDWQVTVEPVSDKLKVLGNLTLPYVYPSEDRYAALLTTPPGRFTEQPALAENDYGKGRVIYSTAGLELEDHISQREIFYRIIRRLGEGFCTELQGYPSVEITRFEKENRTMLHILNYQSELPNVPIHNLTFNAKLYEKKPERVVLLPEGKELPWKSVGDEAEITVPKLQDYCLVCMEYK